MDAGAGQTGSGAQGAGGSGAGRGHGTLARGGARASECARHSGVNTVTLTSRERSTKLAASTKAMEGVVLTAATLADSRGHIVVVSLKSAIPCQLWPRWRPCSGTCISCRRQSCSCTCWWRSCPGPNHGMAAGQAMAMAGGGTEQPAPPVLEVFMAQKTGKARIDDAGTADINGKDKKKSALDATSLNTR
jgi:hypothetical protein